MPLAEHRRLAEGTRDKLEEFKTYLPVLSSICNPGAYVCMCVCVCTHVCMCACRMLCDKLEELKTYLPVLSSICNPGAFVYGCAFTQSVQGNQVLSTACSSACVLTFDSILFSSVSSSVLTNNSHTGMRVRHWDHLSQAVGTRITPGEDLQLARLLKAGILKYMDVLSVSVWCYKCVSLFLCASCLSTVLSFTAESTPWVTNC